MSRSVLTPVLVISMVVVIVAMDLVLFRGQEWFWERLIANIAVVLLFGAIYFRFADRS